MQNRHPITFQFFYSFSFVATVFSTAHELLTMLRPHLFSLETGQCAEMRQYKAQQNVACLTELHCRMLSYKMTVSVQKVA